MTDETPTTYMGERTLTSTHVNGHTIISIGDRHMVHAGTHQPGEDHGHVVHSTQESLEAAVAWAREQEASGPEQTTIEQAWAKWASAALSPEAPLQQRVSMKTAFMCGAGVMLGQVLTADAIPQDSVLGQRIVALGDELAAFMRMIEAGMSARQRADAEAMRGRRN